MLHSSNSQAPLGLDNYQEQTVWMIGVMYGDPHPETVVYMASKADAEVFREEALFAGGTPVLDGVREITTHEATERAGAMGAVKIEVVDANWVVTEWWRV